MAVALVRGSAADPLVDRLDLEIVDAPIAKGRPRFTKGGRAYTPRKTARAEDRLRLFIEEQLPAGWSPLAGPLAIDVVAFMAVSKGMPKRDRGLVFPAKRPDVDNLWKLVADACNGLVWVDDAQVVDAHIVKLYAWDGPPRWRLSVWAIPGPEG